MNHKSKVHQDLHLHCQQNAKIPKSTKDKEKAVNLFEELLRCRNSNGLTNGMHNFKDMKEFSSSDLDYILRYFILEVRNAAGERYTKVLLLSRRLP